jgi:Domain of unknown function (DUF5979)
MLTKLLASLALVACTLLALGAPASAGENLHVEVNKVVVGSASAGTTFTVHYACTGGGPSGDLTFNATGDPIPANDNFFNANVPGTTCTITETGTGGATTVAYACEDDGVNATCAPSGNEATFDSPDQTSNNVTFTVTNTFDGATPTTTPGSTPASATPGAEPATAVAGVPRLTG